MKFFIDTANVDAIRKAHERGMVDGVTTNPSLVAKEGRDFSAIFSAYTKKGILHRGKSRKTGNFDGSLRIVRVGTKITTLYKKKGATEWERMKTFPYTTGDVFFGFKLQNFTSKRTSIKAESSITATFDNFRINAAAGITEEEI